jgi:hypothetical protein
MSTGRLVCAECVGPAFARAGIHPGDGGDRVVELFRLSYARAARAAGKPVRSPSDA